MKVIVRDIPVEQQISPDEAVMRLHKLCKNFRMKYGDRNVVYLEMAIEAMQERYKEFFEWIRQ